MKTLICNMLVTLGIFLLMVLGLGTVSYIMASISDFAQLIILAIVCLGIPLMLFSYSIAKELMRIKK